MTLLSFPNYSKHFLGYSFIKVGRIEIFPSSYQELVGREMDGGRAVEVAATCPAVRLAADRPPWTPPWWPWPFWFVCYAAAINKRPSWERKRVQSSCILSEAELPHLKRKSHEIFYFGFFFLFHQTVYPCPIRSNLGQFHIFAHFYRVFSYKIR